MQRDAPQLPVEIVDVETTGYVLRLCPFEDVAMIGLAEDEVAIGIDLGGEWVRAAVWDADQKHAVALDPDGFGSGL